MERKDIYIELLDCFMRGELPAEQEHELRTWFKQPEVREMLFQHYRHSWTEAEGKELPVEIQNRMFRNIQSRIHAGRERKMEEKSVRKRLFRQWLPYAAAVVFLLGLTTSVHLYMNLVDKTENYSSSLRTAMKASEGTATVPKVRIRFLPSFCFSSSFFLRVMSPP